MTHRLLPVWTPLYHFSELRCLPFEIFHTWPFSLILNECGSDDSELIWLLELQQQRTKQMFNLPPGAFNLSQMLRIFFPGKLNVLIDFAALLQRSMQRFAVTGPHIKLLEAYVWKLHKSRKHDNNNKTEVKYSHTWKALITFSDYLNSTFSSISTTRVLLSMVTLTPQKISVWSYCAVCKVHKRSTAESLWVLLSPTQKFNV